MVKLSAGSGGRWVCTWEWPQFNDVLCLSLKYGVRSTELYRWLWIEWGIVVRSLRGKVRCDHESWLLRHFQPCDKVWKEAGIARVQSARQERLQQHSSLTTGQAMHPSRHGTLLMEPFITARLCRPAASLIGCGPSLLLSPPRCSFQLGRKLDPRRALSFSRSNQRQGAIHHSTLSLVPAWSSPARPPYPVLPTETEPSQKSAEEVSRSPTHTRTSPSFVPAGDCATNQPLC